MDVAVIIGQGTLLGMAMETAEGRYQPYPYTPGFVEPQADEKINGEEPYVTGKSVEYASQQCFLVGHAGQLPVGTVVPIGPDEQKHADEVHLPVAINLQQYDC